MAKMPPIRLALLVALFFLGTVGLLWRWPQHAAASEPTSLTRAHTQTWAEFQPDGDAFLSPVVRAPFGFTAAGVYVEPQTPPVVLSVELRLRADGGAWSPWYAVELEPQADGRLYGENLVAWPNAREAQARVRTSADHPPTLTIVAIDASAGPTANQAVLASLQHTKASPDEPGVPQPPIISRADWGANESWMTWAPEYAPADKVVVHHTVSGGGSDPAAEVRAIYYYHAVTRGWGDIGYNFLVDRFGNIYEGRFGGPDVIGGHVSYWNTGSVGISVLGCYDNSACTTPMVPTDAALDALADLTAWVASRHALDPRQLQDFDNGYDILTNYVLSGHRDFATTTCPGSNLYAKLPDLRTSAWDLLPEYDVRFGWHDTPASMYTGQRVTVYPNLYNYGRLVWSDDIGVRLGYRWLQNGQVVTENTAAAHILTGAVVNYGEMTALVPQLAAPTTPGTYTLRWDLYRDGVGWFADQPAPSGRSLPLDVTVEVEAVAALAVDLTPPAAATGESVQVDITVEGLVGQDFEAHATWPPELQFVAGSGYHDDGSFSIAGQSATWTGTHSAEAAHANFDLLVSPTVTFPLALPLTTTLTVTGHETLTVERWLVVNGLSTYLPLVERDTIP